MVTTSLELVTTPSCGTLDELTRAISARSERIRIESELTASHRLRIEMHEGEGAVTAVLSLTQPNGRRSVRTLRASTCAEALDSAGLVAALSLDPTASLAPVVEAPPVAPTPPAAPPAALPKPVCLHCEPVHTAPREVAHLAWSTLASFNAMSGPAPGWLPGFGVTATLAYERMSWLSPALRLSFSRVERRGFAVEGGRADFSLHAGSVELCPARAALGALRIYPCLARVTGGVLHASGSETTAPAARNRPWWELGSSLVVLFQPYRSLALGASLAVGWPLVRDRFQFEPIEFYHVSSLALSAGAGLGVAFP